MRETDFEQTGTEKNEGPPEPMQKERGQAAAKHGGPEKGLDIISTGFGLKQSQTQVLA